VLVVKVVFSATLGTDRRGWNRDAVLVNVVVSATLATDGRRWNREAVLENVVVVSAALEKDER
jgi:hypothetical protein